MISEKPPSCRSQLLEQLKYTLRPRRFENRNRVPARTAVRILRGEWFQLYSLARRADRAMRSFAARDAAMTAYTAVNALKTEGSTTRNELLLKSLENRPGWTRLGTHEFIRKFGKREVTITMPWRVDAPVLAALITRAEVNAILGDAEWTLLSELQTLAARELQHLCARSS